MKKITIVLSLMLSLTIGVFIGTWLSQEKRSSLVEIATKENSTPESWKEYPLQNIIPIKNSVSSSAYDLQNAFNTVAKVATRAVVSIQVTSVVTRNNNYHDFFGNDDLFRRFFDIPRNNQPRKAEAFGSGFVIDEEGYLLSNNHVVENAEEIKILFKENDKTYTAKIIGTDPDTDIALLKINEPGPFPSLVLGDSEKVEIGDIAIAIGNPFGLSHTFTTGVVSAKGRTGIIGKRYENFIQTDVAINQGNSGGPLLNLNGEVIGINSAILSQSGGSIGIGFSIPVNMVKNVAEQLQKDGKVSRGWIGVYFDTVDSELAEALNVPKGSVLVSRVAEESPAEKSGIKAGDVIFSFNRKTIKNGNDLVNKIGSKKSGDRVTIGIIREGEKKYFDVTLELPQVNQNGLEEKKLGITVRDLTPQELRDLGRKKPIGVKITKIEQISPLLSVGIEVNDIILTINKQAIEGIEDFSNKIEKIEKNSKVLFQIQRGRAIRYLLIRI